MPALPQTLREEDYEAIHAAVMDTARGRWFLTEYASRNRSSDTALVLEAVAKLEQKLADTSDARGRLKSHVREMREVISRLYSDLGQLQDGGGELAAIAGAAGNATQQITAAAEEVQEAAWSLRELGAHPDFCQRLDRLATDIQIACSFREQADGRAAKIMQAMATLEACIKNLGLAIGETAQVENDPETAQPSVPDQESRQSGSAAIEAIPIALAPPSATPTLIEVQNIALPQSSLPQLQAALEEEWPEIGHSAQDNGPRLNLADYSFEEKLALFS